MSVLSSVQHFGAQKTLQLYRGKLSWVQWQNEIGEAGISCVWSNLGGNSGELSSRVIPWLIGALGTPLLSGTDTWIRTDVGTNTEDNKSGYRDNSLSKYILKAKTFAGFAYHVKLIVVQTCIIFICLSQ